MVDFTYGFQKPSEVLKELDSKEPLIRRTVKDYDKRYPGHKSKPKPATKPKAKSKSTATKPKAKKK